MNGATEATLQELLFVANKMNINLEKFTSQLGSSGGSTGGGGSGGLSGLASVAKFATPAGLALGAVQAAASLVGMAFNTLGNVLGRMVTGVIDTGKNLLDFAEKAAMGGAKLSDFYNAFKDLPLGLGVVAGVFAKIVKYSEDLLDTYRNLTKTGAAFSGDLMEMRIAATRSGLSMVEFSKVIGSNSDLFATMGGNVQNGINKFVQASNALLGKDSKFSKDLFGLGYTATDIADGLATVMTIQGVMGKRDALTSEQLAEKTNNYLTELDALTKLTGQSREELDKKLKKDLDEQSFQVFMDSLTEGQKTALTEQINVARAMGGEPAVQAVKNGVRGIFAPMSKEATDFQLTSKGMYTKIAQDAQANLFNTNMSSEQQRTALLRNLQTAGGNINSFAKGLGTQGLALNAEMFAGSQIALKAARIAEQTGISYEEAYKNATDQANAQKKGTAAGLGQAEQNIKNFGNKIMEFVGMALKPITDILVNWGDKLTAKFLNSDGTMNSMFEKAIKFIEEVVAPTLQSIGDWFSEVWDDLMGAENVDEFWTKFKTRMAEGVNNVWQAIKPTIVGLFRELFIAMKAALKETLVGPEVTAENQPQFEQQADINKSVMTTGERISTFLSEGIEGAVGLFSESFAKSMAASRIQSDTEYGLKDKRLKADQVVAPGVSVPSVPTPRANGGPVKSGNYLVGDPGPNTELLKLGGNQTGDVISNENITALVNRAAEADKVITALLQTLNTHNRQMLTHMATTAEFTQRNNDALKDMSGDAFA